MAQTSNGERAFRLQRSSLIVPCTSERFFPKAAASAADAITLDLEDSVAPGRKEEARLAAVAVLNDLDWGQKTMGVRVNGTETPWCYRDIIALAENCPRLDQIVLPMTNRPDDVLFAATLLREIEAATGRSTPIALAPIIETALGMANVEAIAACSERLESLSFGAGDYAASLHARNRTIGAPDLDYAILAPPAEGEPPQRHVSDQWHFAMARLANACRAYGLRPQDSAYADFSDAVGYRAAAVRALVLGYEGKSAIHPSQVPIANEVFSPTPAEVEWARGLVTAMERSQREGHGAAAQDGQMIDIANIKLAENILEKADRIEALHPPGKTP